MSRADGVASKLVPATTSKYCAARSLKIIQASAQLSNAQAPVMAASLHFPPSVKPNSFNGDV
jgi:hypothetical protein